MNPDFPQTPREQLEARLTALLLGELPAEEAAAFRVQVAQDPELAALHDRLKQTIDLVREVSVGQGEPAIAQTAPLMLSEERREKLLAEFKTIKPQPLLPPLPRRQTWLVPVAAAAILLLLAAITLPNFIRARNTAASNALLNNLRQIEAAKQQWAQEHGKSPSDVPSFEDVKDYIKGELPPSVAGETYILGPVGIPPTVETGASQSRNWFFRRSPSTPPQVAMFSEDSATANKRLHDVSLGIQTKPVTLPRAGQPAQMRREALTERYHTAASPRSSSAQIVLPATVDAGAADLTKETPSSASPRVVFGNWSLEKTAASASVAEGRKAGEAVVAQSVTDPEWAGVLERPALPHSTENKFVVRHAYVPDGSVSPTTGLPQPAEGILPEVAAEGKAATGVPLAWADFDGDRGLGLSPSMGQPTAGAVADGFLNRYGLPASPPQGAGRGRFAESVESKVAPLPALALPPPPRQITAGIAGGAPVDTTVESVIPQRGDAAFGELSVARKSVAKPDADQLPVLGDLPKVGVAFQMERPTVETRSGRVSGPEPVAKAAQPEPEMAATELYALDILGRTAQQSPATRRVPLSSTQPVPRVNVAGGVNAGVARAGDAIQDARLLMEAGRSADAEVKLREALQSEPDNRAAGYYLSLARAQQQAGARKLGEDESRKGVVQIALADEPAAASQPYFDKKRELEEAERFRQLLAEKIVSQGIDQTLPKDSAVEIVDRAEAKPSEPQSFLSRLGRSLSRESQATARVKIEPGTSEIAGLSDRQGTPGYDPYFVQTEFEVMQSEAVLGKVVNGLKLDEAWAEKRGGESLKKEEAIAMLRQQLDLRPVRDSGLVEIRAKSDKPEEAAQIANAVAEAYRDHRLEQGRELAARGIAALEDRMAEQEQKIVQARDELERMGRGMPSRPGNARQIIAGKLNGIRMESLNLNGVTLGQVVQMLNEEAKKQDPEKKGIHFILNPNLPAVQASPVDPTTGLPRAGSSTGTMDVGSLAVTSGSTPRDARLTDVLDAIIKSAEQPLKYSVEDYAVVLSLAEPKDLPAPRKPATNAPIPQPEIQTTENAFSTFSLKVSDVAFKLAAASLEQGQMPDPASVRAEEFINAFDYRDPEPAPGVPVAFAWERARYPFAHNRDLLRFSLKTGAAGRQAGRPLNVVLLLDNSGSMERADRVQIIREALQVLAGQLQPQDKLSVITFARTARLVADGLSGDNAGQLLDHVSGLTPQGGTNLEEAMNLGYKTALRHYLAHGINRVVLLTDGAANLGNVEPDSLKQQVETHRKQGVALDCFGIGWEGLNDDLLEVLSRNGDGRYGFINSPDEAATEFAAQLAGALQIAASDVKVQVEFNPRRVTAYRQIGYAKHQLTKEQFRDNTVDAAEIAAQEAGNALYTVEVNPAGEGPLCTVRVRFKIPGTTDYREHEWLVPYTANAVSLEQASPAMRLAASASAFAEWLVASPFAGEVTPDALLGYLSSVPEVYGADARPKKLEWMIRQAKSLERK